MPFDLGCFLSMTLGLWWIWYPSTLCIWIPPLLPLPSPLAILLSRYVSATSYCLFSYFLLKVCTTKKQVQNKNSVRSFLIMKKNTNQYIKKHNPTLSVGSKILTLQHCNDYSNIQNTISKKIASCQCSYATASFIKKHIAIINTNHSDSRNHAINKPIKMGSNIMRWTPLQRYVQVLFPYGGLCNFNLKLQN